MKNKTILLAGLIGILSALPCLAENRRSFDEGWLFLLNDSTQMAQPTYKDSHWRKLDLPHDWAVEGDFSASAPSGAGGGALPGGTGWYRKHFTVSSQELKGHQLFLDLDGVYMNSSVYINGHLLGTRPFGYISMRYELTPYLLADRDNVVAVRVDNSDQPNSRWYSGCGIYRHTWLVETTDTHVSHWGTYITTQLLKNGKANLQIQTSVDQARNLSGTVLCQTLMDAQGKVLTSKRQPLTKEKQYQTQLTLAQPQLWSVDHPYLYKVRTQIIRGKDVVDTYDTPIGIRTFRFDAKQGFSLNGKAMKINGVCLHHDFGCIGTALYQDALIRQLAMMKEMGVNAIRCTHNPPAPELLDACDSLGLMVLDESFDMWRRKKTQNDYARFFDEWHEKDLTDMLLRDRNHPSIIAWSIGNEVLEQWPSADADTLSIEQANLILNLGHKTADVSQSDTTMHVNSILTKHLCDLVRKYDTTRPITAGCNEPSPANLLFQANSLDIIGYNYHLPNIADVPKNFPDKPFILTESVSALQSRGTYVMPSDSDIVAPSRWDIAYTAPSYTRSSYDNSHVPWGNTHEETWDLVKHNAYVSGQFIWTGWDYIGEPTPFQFPAHSSYFGIVDLAGFPKDVYYMYQSEWTDKTVLHLFPHWNWLPGQNVDVWCYYNHADEVELYVNHRSVGVRKKDDHTYHAMWRVPFEAGEIQVVSRKDGKQVATETIHTAGQPHHLRLTADRTELLANGRNLSFVQVEVVDEQGNVCPWADDELYFTLEGDTQSARILGVGNGDAASLQRFQDNHRKAYYGKALVVLKSGKTTGKIQLKAQAIGLQDQTLEFTIK